MKNVIIFGHLLHSHTHSYIHYGYQKAFNFLNFDTKWIANSNINLNQSDEYIFFTEAQQDSNIPLNKNYKYILHHCNLNKYISAGIPMKNIVNLCNYVIESEKFEKINDLCYWDEKTRSLYQTWATDLLPQEIDNLSPCIFDESIKDSFYIGNIYEESIDFANKFNNLLNSSNKKIVIANYASFNQNIDLVRNSYLSIDIRNNHHKKTGYIPCRIYKNTSYGKLTGTNSQWVYNKLPQISIYGESPEELFYNLIEANKKETSISLRNKMNFIKENHTYINRINNILKFL